MKISMLDSLGISLLGMVIVFAVLIILMAIIFIMSVFTKRGKRKSALESASQNQQMANGRIDGNKFNVPDSTAAMVMALVADALDAPLSELRFISIREVEESK